MIRPTRRTVRLSSNIQCKGTVAMSHKQFRGALAAFAVAILACASVGAQTPPTPPAAGAGAPSAPAAGAPAPAEAATAPTNLPAPGVALTTNVENPYGLKALWEQGDV